MDHERRIAALEALLARLLGSVAAADAKVGPVFAIDTAMLGVLAVLAPKVQFWKWQEAVLAMAAGLFLLVSILMLSLASFPRTSGPKKSVLFFGSICKQALPEYLEAVEALTMPDYLKDIASQCHRNAEIAARKYFWIRRAMMAMYVSVPFWLLAIFLLYRRRT